MDLPKVTLLQNGEARSWNQKFPSQASALSFSQVAFSSVEMHKIKKTSCQVKVWSKGIFISRLYLLGLALPPQETSTNVPRMCTSAHLYPSVASIAQTDRKQERLKVDDEYPVAHVRRAVSTSDTLKPNLKSDTWPWKTEILYSLVSLWEGINRSFSKAIDRICG